MTYRAIFKFGYCMEYTGHEESVYRQWHRVQNLLDALSFSEGFCRTAPQFKSHEVTP